MDEFLGQICVFTSVLLTIPKNNKNPTKTGQIQNNSRKSVCVKIRFFTQIAKALYSFRVAHRMCRSIFAHTKNEPKRNILLLMMKIMSLIMLFDYYYFYQ